MSSDITLEDTIYRMFSTRAFATGIPTTLAGSPVVSAYENENVTQITAGITLGVDHDGVTGMHLLTIVATTANGYESGKDYTLVITTGTVDAVSVVGEVVGEFTIGRSAAAVDLANGADGLGALKALLDAIPTTAMRGTDNAALASAWTSALATALASYTTARAEYLDELAAANIPADVDTLKSRLSAARANYLENLSAGLVALEDTLTTMKQTSTGTFDRDTESLEAIRNRGDAAWVAGIQFVED